MALLLKLEPGDVLFLTPKPSREFGPWINIAAQRFFRWRNAIAKPDAPPFTHVAIAAAPDAIIDAVPKEDQAVPADGAIRFGDESLVDVDGYYDFKQCIVAKPPAELRYAVSKELIAAWTFYGPVYPRIVSLFNAVAGPAGTAAPEAFYRPIGSPQSTVYCSQFVARVYDRAIQQLKKSGWQARRMEWSGEAKWVSWDVPADMRDGLTALAQRLSRSEKMLPVALWEALGASHFTFGPLEALELSDPGMQATQIELQRASTARQKQLMADAAKVLSLEVDARILIAEQLRSWYRVAAALEMKRPAFANRFSTAAKPCEVVEGDQIVWSYLPHAIPIAVTTLLDALKTLRQEEGSAYATGGIFDISLFKLRCVVIGATTSLRGWARRLDDYARAVQAAPAPAGLLRWTKPGTKWVRASGDDAVVKLRKIAGDLLALRVALLDDELRKNEEQIITVPEDDPRIATALLEVWALMRECRGLAQRVTRSLQLLSSVQDRAGLQSWAREVSRPTVNQAINGEVQQTA